MDETQNLTTFAAPTLKTDEIILCMQDLNISLTEAEILEPHRYKDKIHGVFITLLEVCMGITPSDLVKPGGFNAMQCLTNPGLYDDSISSLALFRAVSKLMRACAIMDFGLSDFHTPSSKRLKRQLSAAINLVKFREERIQMYRELNGQMLEMLEQLDEVKMEHHMATKELEGKKALSATQWNEMEQVENDNMDLETQIAILNKQQAATRLESGNLKKKANELKDETETAIIALQEAQAEQRKLASLVVKSPERKKRNMLNLTKTLEKERMECEKAEQQAQHGKLCIEIVQNSEKLVNGTIAIIDEALIEQENYDSICAEIKNAQEKIEKNEKMALELNNLIDESMRELQRFDEKIDRLRNHAKSKKDDSKKTLEEAQEELLVVEKEKRDGLARVEESESRLISIRRLIAQEEEDAKTDIDAMIESYKRVEDTVLKTTHKLDTFINAF